MKSLPDALRHLENEPYSDLVDWEAFVRQQQHFARLQREAQEYLSKHPDMTWERMKEPVVASSLSLDFWTDRLDGPGGEAQTGPTVQEVTPYATKWWNGVGRNMVAMSTSRDSVEAGGVPSGILRGLPFEDLQRDECVTVILTWYQHIGYPTMIDTLTPPDEWIIDRAADAGGNTQHEKPEGAT